MKTPLLIVLTVTVLIAGGAMAVMNNACKSEQHVWCAPTTVRHHIKPRPFTRTFNPSSISFG
jgi:hypothetical protein